MALGQQGRYDEALDAFARALEVDRIPILTTMLAHTHAIAGDRNGSLRLLGDLLNTARTRYISPYDIAVIHAGLGDNAEAIQHLQAAHADRSPWMVFVPVDPRLDGLRNEPAFAEIRAALH
jgi:tetratricopeptide (TPR) repeat protein